MAQQRGPEAPRPTRRMLGQVGVGAVMALSGALFAVSARTAGGGALRDESASVEGSLRARAARVDRLQREVADKRAELDRRSAGRADADPERERLISQAVGLSAVAGPGLRVTLSDAPAGAISSHPDVEPDDLVVHQQDMEAFINAIWSGGAEAMMLQDQRVVLGSAFRCAGNTLLLEGRVYSPPFVITAIGDPAVMRGALDESDRVRVYRQWVDYVGLGEKVETLDRVSLPGFDGSLSIDIAKAAP